MSSKLARIKAVLSRKALSEEEQEEKIDEIVNEDEESEGEPPVEEDEESENAAEGEDEETEATDEEDPEAEDEEEQPSAKRAAAALKSARRIAASKEAKANPGFALAAIAKGVNFAAFRAMAPAAGKTGGGLAARMENEPAARRLSADAPAPNRSGKVVNLKPAADYYAACAGTKTG